MKGLVIRSPWIDLILDGSKTWEMRSRATGMRGTIALIKAGSGMVYGTADLIDCLPALSVQQMRETTGRHGIPPDKIDAAAAQGWTTPWVLDRVKRFDTPVRYEHPNGAVTWVDLAGKLRDGPIGTAPTRQAQPVDAPRSPDRPAAKRPSEAPAVSTAPHVAPSADWEDIPLTDGNLRNGHFYLRLAERLLPADCIGGPNKATAGAPIHVRFDPGMAIDTDVAGDKMILRERGAVRDFFERTGASVGDFARFARVADRSFRVTLVRAR